MPEEISVDSFGKELYSIKQTESSNFGSRDLLLTFYQNFIVVMDSRKFCCYPKGYSVEVVPRCSVIGAKISKSNVKGAVVTFEAIMGLCGLVVLIASIVVGLSGDDNNDNNNEGNSPTSSPTTSAATPSPTVTPSGLKASWPAMAGAGAGVFVVCIFLMILPCLCRDYFITLKLMAEKDSSAAGVFAGLRKPTMEVMVKSKPDANFIIDYVYGKLAGNMDGAHIAAHQIANNIYKEVQPTVDITKLDKHSF